MIAYGSAALFVFAGALCALFVGGTTGGALGLALALVGFVGAALLVFLDIGLGEDRDRALEEERRALEEERRARAASTARPRQVRRPRRPG